MFIGEQQYSFDDFLETTISAGHDIVTTGDVDVYIADMPDRSTGWLVLSSANETDKEIVYFHAKGADYVSVKAINRGLGGTTATTHTAGVAVQCNVVGDMFEGAYEILKRVTGGYVSKLASTGLYAYITEWSGFIGGTYYTYTGSGISGQLLTDDSTNYIYLNSSGVLTISTSEFPTDGSVFIMLAEVVTASGSISTIDNLAGKKIEWHGGLNSGDVTAEIGGTDYTKSKIIAGDYVTLSVNGDTIVVTAEPGTGSPNNWTNVNANLLPSATNSWDIGSSSLKFKDMHLEGDITIGGTFTGNIAGNYVNTFNTKTGAIVVVGGTDITITESPAGTFTIDSDVVPYTPPSVVWSEITVTAGDATMNLSTAINQYADLVANTVMNLTGGSEGDVKRLRLIQDSTGSRTLIFKVVDNDFAIGDVDTVADTIVVDASIPTGNRIIFTGASLPTGLVAATEYFAINVDATTIKVATTRALAKAGTQIDITATGSGNVYSKPLTAGGADIALSTDPYAEDNIIVEYDKNGNYVVSNGNFNLG